MFFLCHKPVSHIDILLIYYVSITLSLCVQIHCQRLKAREYYSDGEIAQAIEDIFIYQKLHQDRPGLFDAAINTGTYSLPYMVQWYKGK